MPTIEELNEQVIAFLKQDELDYPAGAIKFGAAVLPLLKALIDGSDENLAIKAAYLAGYIKHDSVKDIIADAASNKFTAVRIAAAYSSQKLSATDAGKVLEKSLGDVDPGVLKVAIRSVEQLNIAKNFKSQLSNIGKAQLDLDVKGFANDLIQKIK